MAVSVVLYCSGIGHGTSGCACQHACVMLRTAAYNLLPNESILALSEYRMLLRDSMHMQAQQYTLGELGQPELLGPYDSCSSGHAIAPSHCASTIYSGCNAMRFAI